MITSYVVLLILFNSYMIIGKIITSCIIFNIKIKGYLKYNIHKYFFYINLVIYGFTSHFIFIIFCKVVISFNYKKCCLKLLNNSDKVC